MSLFVESDLRQRALAGSTIQKSATLEGRAMTHDSAPAFDIFLSHSFNDKELVDGIRMSLEDMGFSVYVDWVHDKELSRDKVTPETAQVLRSRMEMSKCLFFATTASSGGSKWMPWELGYMDGMNGRAAILPVAQKVTHAYAGQEYLGVYPYVQRDPAKGAPRQRLWIHRSPSNYILFEDWLKGQGPIQR